MTRLRGLLNISCENFLQVLHIFSLSGWEHIQFIDKNSWNTSWELRSLYVDNWLFCTWCTYSARRLKRIRTKQQLILWPDLAPLGCSLVSLFSFVASWPPKVARRRIGGDGEDDVEDRFGSGPEGRRRRWAHSRLLCSSMVFDGCRGTQSWTTSRHHKQHRRGQRRLIAKSKASLHP